MKNGIKILGLGLLFGLPLACAQQKGNEAPLAQSAKPPTKEIVQKKGIKPVNPLEEIAPLIKLECDHNAQCKTIGFGASPCGGSPEYLIYSAQSSHVSKLTKMIKNYNKSQKLMQQKKGIVGTCQHIPPPKTFCSKQTNTCVTEAESLL